MTAPSQVERQVRAAFAREVLEILEPTPCAFWACPGPDVAPIAMGHLPSMRGDALPAAGGSMTDLASRQSASLDEPARVVWQRFRVAPGRGPSVWAWRQVPVEVSGWKRAKELR